MNNGAETVTHLNSCPFEAESSVKIFLRCQNNINLRKSNKK